MSKRLRHMARRLERWAERLNELSRARDARKAKSPKCTTCGKRLKFHGSTWVHAATLWIHCDKTNVDSSRTANRGE